jgi:hypothetical protein
MTKKFGFKSGFRSGLLVTGVFLFVLDAKGSEHFIDQGKRLEIPISNIGVNRLVLANDRVLKIVGSEDEYIVEGDAARGQAFITSKLGNNEKSFATIISEKGVVQDVVFKVDGDAPPALVVLKHKGRKSTVSHEESITRRIQDILAGRTRAFRQRPLSRNSFEMLPFKTLGAIEYLSLKHRYVWVELLEESNSDSLKGLHGVIAIAKQDNHLILVEKL